jgi:sec-independent protein translocase protein TatC
MALDNTPPDELAGTEQPFVQHLVELRDRLIKAAIAVGIVLCIPALLRCMTSWRNR